MPRLHEVFSGIGLGGLIGIMITLLPRPELSLVPFIGLLGAIFVGHNLHLGLALLVFITYARLSDTLVHFHSAPSIALPLIIGFLILSLFRWVNSSNKPRGLMAPIGIMLVYLIACLTSLIVAKDPAVTLLGLEELLKNLIFAITLMLLIQHNPDRGLQASFWALMLSGLLMGGVSVFQYLTHTFESDFGGLAQAAEQHLSGTVQTFRISGPIGDPNFFAQILLVIVPLSIDRLMHAKAPLIRILAFMVFCSTFFSILFTFSRGALVGLGGMLALVLINHRPSKWMMITGLLLTLISLCFLPERYLDRLTSLFDAIGSSGSVVVEDSLRGRISELVSGLLMFMEHPLVGVGLGNYPVEYQDYARQLGYDSRHTERHAHNMFLEWIAETGLFGGIALTAVIWMMFKRMRLGHQALLLQGDLDGARMVSAFRLGIWGFLIASLFLHAALPRYFWLFAAIAMAIPGPLIERRPSSLRPQDRSLRTARSVL